MGSRLPGVSFEFFPPKTPEAHAGLMSCVERLARYRPEFASVTYGAAGSNRERSFETVKSLAGAGLETVAHLTCVGQTRRALVEYVEALHAAGVRTILALRGDRPADGAVGELSSVVELIHLVKRVSADFSIGVAGYPERHPESRDRSSDLDWLCRKVEAGADFIVTQLFLSNECFLDFQALARERRISVPILPGVLPFTSLAQLERITGLCKATIPDRLRRRLAAVGGDDGAVRRELLDHAYAQCAELVRECGSPLHFYTLNQSAAVETILDRLESASEVGNSCQDGQLTLHS